jgi:hypothetical protein
MIIIMIIIIIIMTHKICNLENFVGSSVFAVPSLTSTQYKGRSLCIKQHTYSVNQALCFNRRHFAA